MTQHELRDAATAKAEVWELIQALVLGHVPASHILELYYWTQEHTVLELTRSFCILPPEGRKLLRAFLAVARPQTITVTVDEGGRLILTSPDIKKAEPVLRRTERDERASDPPA